MGVRPYLLLSDKSIERISAVLEDGVQAWSQDWFASEILEMTLQAFDAEKISSQKRYFQYLSELNAQTSKLLTVSLTDALLKSLSKSSFGLSGGANNSKSRYDVENEFANRCLDDLIARLIDSADIESSVKRIEIEELNSSKNSGQLVLSIMCTEGLTLQIVIESALSRALLSKATNRIARKSNELIDRANTIGLGKLDLVATIGEIETNLNSIDKLQIGDVLKLDRKITEPLDLLVEDTGQPVCQAHLATSGGKKVLVVTK